MDWNRKILEQTAFLQTSVQDRLAADISGIYRTAWEAAGSPMGSPQHYFDANPLERQAVRQAAADKFVPWARNYGLGIAPTLQGNLEVPRALSGAYRQTAARRAWHWTNRDGRAARGDPGPVDLRRSRGALSHAWPDVRLRHHSGRGQLGRRGNMLVGHIRGGLAHVVVLVGMFFGGCTGSAVAESSAMGSIMISMMERSGYDRKFSTALICASSIMGPIIPPSILMVVYALAVPGVGVASLLLSGVIPGMLIAVFLMAANYMYALKRNYPKEKFQLNFGRVVKTLKETIWALLLPVVIMGGIISGAFTVTEASGMGVLYTLVITWMFSRKPDGILR